MKKDGFISMSIIYSFLIVFIFINVSIISVYSKKNAYLDSVREQVSESTRLNYEEK